MIWSDHSNLAPQAQPQPQPQLQTRPQTQPQPILQNQLREHQVQQHYLSQQQCPPWQPQQPQQPQLQQQLLQQNAITATAGVVPPLDGTPTYFPGPEVPSLMVAGYGERDGESGNEQELEKRDDLNSRGEYLCSFCGKAKAGHVCDIVFGRAQATQVDLKLTAGPLRAMAAAAAVPLLESGHSSSGGGSGSGGVGTSGISFSAGEPAMRAGGTTHELQSESAAEAVAGGEDILRSAGLDAAMGTPAATR